MSRDDDEWVLGMHCASTFTNVLSCAVWYSGIFNPSTDHFFFVLSLYDLLISVGFIAKSSCHLTFLTTPKSATCRFLIRLQEVFLPSLYIGTSMTSLLLVTESYIAVKLPVFEYRSVTPLRCRIISMALATILLMWAVISSFNKAIGTVISPAAAVLIGMAWMTSFLLTCLICKSFCSVSDPTSIATTRQQEETKKLRKYVLLCVIVSSFSSSMAYAFLVTYLVMDVSHGALNLHNYASKLFGVALPLKSVFNFNLYFTFISAFRHRLLCRSGVVNVEPHQSAMIENIEIYPDEVFDRSRYGRTHCDSPYERDKRDDGIGGVDGNDEDPRGRWEGDAHYSGYGKGWRDSGREGKVYGRDGRDYARDGKDMHEREHSPGGHDHEKHVKGHDSRLKLHDAHGREHEQHARGREAHGKDHDNYPAAHDKHGNEHDPHGRPHEGHGRDKDKYPKEHERHERDYGKANVMSESESARRATLRHDNVIHRDSQYIVGPRKSLAMSSEL